jgi:hypothetical protein
MSLPLPSYGGVACLIAEIAGIGYTGQTLCFGTFSVLVTPFNIVGFASDKTLRK